MTVLDILRAEIGIYRENSKILPNEFLHKKEGVVEMT